jgi:two-component system, OmpR family, phosphate regulon sensor histidine kinase PhoR
MDFGVLEVILLIFAFGAGALVTRYFYQAGKPGTAPDLPEPVDENAFAAKIVGTMPVPVIVVDQRGIVAHANQAAIQNFGIPAEGTLLFLRFRSPEFRSAVESALQRSGRVSFDTMERGAAEQWLRVDVVPLPKDDENRQLFAVFLRDGSEQHRLDQMRSDFVANASHELRTPLASMTGFIETLKGPARNDAAARDRFLDIMQQQGERMARLIDDLLSLSRLEMRPFVSLNEMIDLRAVSDDVIDALKPLAADLGIVIERSYRIEDSFPVAGVRDELIQVAENLVENACKYGQAGGRVVISLRTIGGETSYGVRDFGPGIAAEHIPRLTERFYRVDAGASRAQKGTGLGLAIVKHILTRHRANLKIESKPGEGAEFTVNFPTPVSVANSGDMGEKSIVSDN